MLAKNLTKKHVSCANSSSRALPQDMECTGPLASARCLHLPCRPSLPWIVAQLHMSKLNGFRLPADNKNGCFHITYTLYASFMLFWLAHCLSPPSDCPTALLHFLFCFRRKFQRIWIYSWALACEAPAPK